MGICASKCVCIRGRAQRTIQFGFWVGSICMGSGRDPDQERGIEGMGRHAWSWVAAGFRWEDLIGKRKLMTAWWTQGGKFWGLHYSQGKQNPERLKNLLQGAGAEWTRTEVWVSLTSVWPPISELPLGRKKCAAEFSLWSSSSMYRRGTSLHGKEAPSVSVRHWRGSPQVLDDKTLVLG